MADADEPQPGPLNYVVGFTLVGIAWGLTTPFIRRAAKDHHPAPHPVLESDAVRASWLRSRAYGAFFAVLDLLRNPRYAVPLLLNLTGSVWFFLLIGKAGESRPAQASWGASRCGALGLHAPLLSLSFLTDSALLLRTEPDCAHRQHACVPVHSRRGLVGRWEGY